MLEQLLHLNATFKITDTVPFVILSLQDDNKLLEQLKIRFERSKMSNESKNKNLNYLIDPAFTKVNRWKWRW